jgi:hypothetical protein
MSRLLHADDKQAYSEALLIVYQRGFADGKQAAQRKPLTDEEIGVIFRNQYGWAYTLTGDHANFARAIEAAHNIKEQS